MYFEKSIGVFMGAFVVWGFLMAMLFNLMLIGFKAKKDFKLVLVSIIMFISYFISDHFFGFFSTSDMYLTWFIYDLVTLLIILPALTIGKSKVSPGVVYVIIGLSLNSLLFLFMHLDITVQGNREEWWLWSVYSIGVNVIDFFMIVVLIVDKDIFGFITLKNYVKHRVTTHSSSFLSKFSQNFQIQQS
ncbi:hypothetical protein [Pseudoalteromonas sp. T1lg75]|uniref:hypothetical protein n=1 Tax=Pseudoalteromonas sp. T1lg75 TaxID=2077102 RepID=UPI000CF6B0AD|nr:hypothetical protein [Pseudoalteromonas sp. T1lg75]